jgi:hypothetical protein
VEDTRTRAAEPEWLIVNPVDSKPRASQLRRWTLIGALALALIMITAARVSLSQEADDVARSSSSTTPHQVSSEEAKQDQNDPVALRKPRVLRHGRPLLPTRSSWELYAGTDTEVIKIEPGAGRVTGTGVRKMPSTEPRAGVLVPTGPQVWVMRECDTRRFCRRVIIDQRGRSQRNVDLAQGNVSPWLATMSPDGRYVSVVYASATQPVTLHLLDVRRGSSRVTTVQVDRTIHGASFAWSPDSDYLFVAGVNGILWVIEPATAAVSEFPARLPPVRHLAVTPAQR